MAEMTHSQVGASSCERWWNCPGSNALIARLPKAETSKYAAEGTVAHTICEQGLRTMINHPNNAICTCTGSIDREYEEDDFVIKVTEEMAEGSQLYQTTIKEDAIRIGCISNDRLNKDWINIEQSFELTNVDAEARGTNDASILVPGETLIVYDYKYGKGIPVEAIENKQMLYYAIGAAGDKLLDFKSIELVIIQPRASHPEGPVRRWVTTPDYVAKFKSELGVRIRKTREESAQTQTGKWCRFCNAKMICPAMRTTVNNVAKMDFQAPVAKNVVRRPMDLTKDELKLFLDNAEILENYIKDVRAYAFNILDKGDIIEGWKLVRGGKCHRKWREDDEETLATMLELEGLDYDKLFTRKIKTPAQVEKLLKGGKEIVASYSYKPEGELTLTRDEDLRERQTPTAISDFADIDIGL